MSGCAGIISRPAVAVPRLSLSSTGKVVYTLKTPYRDGTTQVAFEPVDFIARLAALVPKPRVNLTRYHGVLAPNHRWRGLVTPARRGKGIKSISNAEVRTPAERHAAMTWAQRLKRVFRSSTSRSAVAAADLSGSSRVSRTRTSSTGSWLTCARKNRKHRLGHCWCHRPERHLGQGELMRSIKRGCPGVRCLFSLGRIPAQQHSPARKPVKTAWHELLRALVQE